MSTGSVGDHDSGVRPLAGSPTLARARLSELYRAHFDFLWRTARAVGVPSAHLDDVVQDTFLVAMRKASDFEGRSSERTWLAGILVRLAANLRRKEQRRRGEPVDAPGAPPLPDPRSVSPEQAVARGEAADTLLRVLDQLDSGQRTVWVLAELERLSAREIGEVLGMSPNTASSRLRLARRRVRREIRRAQARDGWRTG